MRGDYSWLSCHNGATSIQQIHHHYPRVTLSWVLRILDPHTCHNGLRMEWNQIDPVTFNTTALYGVEPIGTHFTNSFFFKNFKFNGNISADTWLSDLNKFCLCHDRQTKLFTDVFITIRITGILRAHQIELTFFFFKWITRVPPSCCQQCHVTRVSHMTIKARQIKHQSTIPYILYSLHWTLSDNRRHRKPRHQ